MVCPTVTNQEVFVKSHGGVVVRSKAINRLHLAVVLREADND